MIPFPSWLTNIQFVVGTFAAFAFFAAAWLNVNSWAVRKEFKTGLRALGFLILAVWSALHGIDSEGTIISVISAIALAAGSLAIAISYAINKLPRQSKDLTSLRKKQQEEKIAQALREPSSADKPHPPKPGAPLTLQPKTPTRPPAPSKANVAPKKMTAHQTGAYVGLRTEALVKLPKTAKRRRTRLVAGLLSLLASLAIFTTIGYLWFNKSRTSPAEPEPLLIIEVSPEPSATAEETPLLEEQIKPTVTIKETETGFLNVRGGASVATPIITQINPGDSYELLEKNEAGDWYKIQVDDNAAGWVAARYVTK